MRFQFDSRKLLFRQSNEVAFVGAVGIMFIAGAEVLDVFMRTVFNSPILGVDDLSKYNLAVIVASFFPLCLVGNHLVTIRFLGHGLGMRVNLWLEVLGGLGTLVIMVLLAWQIFRFTLYDVTYTGLSSVVLELPQAPWWWLVTVFVIVSVGVQALVVLDRVQCAIAGRPRDTEGEGTGASVA